MREPADHLDFLRALEQKPYQYDFFQTLRRIECLFPDKPRLGRALRPVDEPLRLGQDVSMTFAPSSIAAFKQGHGGGPPHLLQSFFGLLGPNGPLPLHLTEYTRERLMHHGDATLAHFFDLFHHRLLELFYRAWAQAQPTVSLDRPREDRFSVLVGALIGIGTSRLRGRDAAGDFAKLFHAGLLARQVRNADGLQAMLGSYFQLEVRVEQFAACWMTLPARDRTRLGTGSAGAQLGVGAVLGGRVWDRQHKFRLRLGPLTLAQYESFLPGGTALPKLVALIRQYLCFELDWDVQLALRHDEVPRMRVGAFGRLGWTTWVGRACSEGALQDLDQLTLHAESVLARHESVSA